MTEHNDDGMSEAFAFIHATLHQPGPDALLLAFRQDSHRGKGRRLSIFSFDVDAAEQNVPEDLPIFLSHQ